MANSKDIKALLYNRHRPPEYAFFTEVANGTGSMGGRYADAVAYALWPSKGFEITGYEIKVSRGDFMNEMKNSAKAHAVMQFCHRWYLVAEKGVAKVEEIPANWGFLEVVNGKFYTRKIAPLLTPIPCDQAFVAAMLRRATEHSIPKEALDQFRKEEQDRWEKFYKEPVERAEKRHEDLKKKIKEFEEASGIAIDQWKPAKEVGEAVRFVLDGGFKSVKWDADQAIHGLEEMLKRVKEYKSLMVVKDEK